MAVILLLAGSACAGSIRQDTANPTPLLEMRLAYTDPGEERERHVFEGEVLYLARHALLSDSDLRSVRANLDQGGNGTPGVTLEVECTPEAHERLLTASGQHIDQRLAFLFDGEVRSAPVVRSTVGCAKAHVHLPASASEVEQIVQLVRARWPDPP